MVEHTHRASLHVPRRRIGLVAALGGRYDPVAELIPHGQQACRQAGTDDGPAEWLDLSRLDGPLAQDRNPLLQVTQPASEISPLREIAHPSAQLVRELFANLGIAYVRCFEV